MRQSGNLLKSAIAMRKGVKQTILGYLASKEDVGLWRGAVQAPAVSNV